MKVNTISQKYNTIVEMGSECALFYHDKRHLATIPIEDMEEPFKSLLELRSFTGKLNFTYYCDSGLPLASIETEFGDLIYEA